MADEIWVVADRDGAKLNEVTLEILGDARGLAERLGRRLCAIVMCHRAGNIVETLASHGADKVYLADHELLSEYSTGVFVQVMVALVRQSQPSMIFFGATANGGDLAASLAARLKIPVATDCVQFEVDSEGSLRVTRPVYGDQAYETLSFHNDKPCLVTVRPGVIGVEQPVVSRVAEVVEVEPQIDIAAMRTRLKRRFKPDPTTLPLSESEMVVSGGGGVSNKEGWSLVEDIANALGASVGGSRVAADLGLIPPERMVGQSGATIAPSLYLAVGISGATHHIQGMRNSGAVIAINTDRSAPIFSVADLKIISDFRQLLPVLSGEIRKSRDT